MEGYQVGILKPNAQQRSEAVTTIHGLSPFSLIET
jgi:hypothetical protein